MIKTVLSGVVVVVILNIATASAVADAPAAQNQPERLQERLRVVRTAPVTEGITREEKERNYRSCLFTFLPGIGSDAGAEMIRDACRDEYLQ